MYRMRAVVFTAMFLAMLVGFLLAAFIAKGVL